MAQQVTATIKVYNASGTFLNEFPGYVSMNVQDTFNDIGVFTLNYPVNALNASSLQSNSDIQIAVCIDYADGNGYTEVWRGIYEQDNFDAASPESAVIQATGRSMVSILGNAVVYPGAGVGSTNAYTSFVIASPGKIMHDLIVAAQARGCFPGLSMSFTTGADSSGNAWSQSYTYSYSIGTSYLDVLTGLAQAGLVDFSMSGTTLNLYNAGTTLTSDLSSTVFLRRKRDIIDLPVSRDRTKIGTAVLIAGDNGLNVERKNTGQISALGRREKYLAQAGVSDSGTLNFWGDQLLGTVDDQQLSYVGDLVVNSQSGTSPMPWKDYKPGNYVSTDISGTPVKMQARQLTATLSAGGALTVQATMNDVFYAAEVLFNGKLQALSGSVIGGTGTGGSASIAILPGPNATIPNPPALTVSSTYTGAYYSPATGTTLAQVELVWSTPTNVDGTPINDGANYLIQYKLSTTPIYPLAWSQLQGKPWSSINGNPWTNPLATPQNTQWTTVQVAFDQNQAIISGLICGETYDFQFATTDVSGNTSLFSTLTALATARDTVAPSQPDAPQVAASMVAVQVTHDLGKASGGTYNLEQDLDHLEVHYSYDPAFTPVAGVTSPTYLGKVIANAGMMQAGIAAVGNFNVTNTTAVYIKVIAVDESGNSSPASPSSGVTTTLIDDSHISSLTVSKLLAGTINASVLLASSISTAVSGARVSIDGGTDALYTYDANGVLIGAWAGKSGVDPSTSVAFPAGWSIFNDPGPGYMNVVSQGAGGNPNFTPYLNFVSSAASSTQFSRIYAAGNAALDLEAFYFQGPISSGDATNSNAFMFIEGGGVSPLAQAHGVMQYVDSSTNVSRLVWDANGVSITQGPSGGLQVSGTVLQNTSAGINYRYRHLNQIAGTTNGSGQFVITHGCPFTPVFGYATVGPGGALQMYLSSFTSTQCTITVYNPNGTLYTSNGFIAWIELLGY